jgi:hypothetical protein
MTIRKNIYVGLSIPVFKHPYPAFLAIYPRHKTLAYITRLDLMKHLTPGTLTGNNRVGGFF